MKTIEKNRIAVEQQENLIVGRLWLHYYNQTLHEKALISDRDYCRMKAKINSWKPQR